MSMLLEIDNLVVRYRSHRTSVAAVDGVSLRIRAGETFGLVGESGCGKSSLGKAVMRLIEPEEGSIRLNGLDITHMRQSELRPHRANFQMIFQDPGGSLDPRQRIGKQLAEPLRVQGKGNTAEYRKLVAGLLEKIGLPADAIDRWPHEFSGGQRQRIAIARALALNPQIVVCDEPVSALDVSLQAQILNLLSDLQQTHGMAYLFISHDLSVVQQLADQVAVMYLGQIVETAPRRAFWRAPAHPYTRALIDSVPVMDPERRRLAETERLAGELPNPAAPPPGCRFNTRCPHAVGSCFTVAPVLQQIAPGHSVACHLYNPAAGVPDNIQVQTFEECEI